MSKATMTDAQVKSLMTRINGWMRERDLKAAEKVAMRKGGKVKIPKRPVRTAGKKTVPAKLDWGKGVTKDKLAYINADEEALLRRRRGDAPVRRVKGIPAYAEETVGPGGGGSSSGKGGSGGASSSSGSAAGAGGNSGSSAPSNSGSSSTDDKKSSGPSRGPTDAPAAVGPSKAAAAPSAPAGSSFGPRSSAAPAAKDPTQTASAQAAKMATDAALSAISRGSIANPSTGSTPKSITDSVPSAAQRAAGDVARAQSSKMGGMGDYGTLQGDIAAGANSPMADVGVNDYDRNAMDAANAVAAAKTTAMADNTGTLGPSVPAGTAVANVSRYSGQPTAPDVNAAMAASAKAIQDRVPQATAIAAGPSVPTVNPQTGLPMGEKIQDRVPGAITRSFDGTPPDPIGMTNVAMTTPAAPSKQFTDRVAQDPTFVESYRPPQAPAPSAPLTPQIAGRTTIGVSPNAAKYSSGDYADYRAAQSTSPVAGKAINDRLDVQTPYGAATPAQIASLSPEDQARINKMAQTPTYEPGPSPVSIGKNISGVGNYASINGDRPAGLAAAGVNPAAYNALTSAVDSAPTRPAATVAAASEPTRPYVDNNSPVEQADPSTPYASKVQNMAAKVGNTVTPALNAVDDFLGRIFGSGNSAYKGQLANGADGSNGMEKPPGGGSYSVASAGSKSNKVPNVTLPPLPPYVNYQNIPGTTSPGIVLPPASQPILDYIQGGYADGGAIKPVTSYGIRGAPQGGLAPMIAPAAPVAVAPASTTANTAPSQSPANNPWGLEGIGDKKKTDGTDGGRASISLPSAEQFQASFSKWMHDRLGQGGFQGVFGIPEVFGNGGKNGSSSGGGGGWTNYPGTEHPGGTGDGTPPTNTGSLTGAGTPGAWSAPKTGWKQGGYVNDRVAAALRLARSMRA